MLSALELENFKGIATRQRVDFAPLTLLFGANSAGKSTILQALLYLHELLERGTADVDRTELGAPSSLWAGSRASFTGTRPTGRSPYASSSPMCCGRDPCFGRRVRTRTRVRVFRSADRFPHGAPGPTRTRYGGTDAQRRRKSTGASISA